MTLAIHHITPANAALLARVDPDVFDHTIDPPRLSAYAASPLHAMFVALDGDLVVGQIRGSVHLQPDRAPDRYIDNLGTAPSHQRRGVASNLMSRLLDWGRECGCTHAWVATETDNEGAKGFYAARHFAHNTITMYEREMD